MKVVGRQLPIALVFSAIVVTISVSVEAQQPAKIARLGYVSSGGGRGVPQNSSSWSARVCVNWAT